MAMLTREEVKGEVVIQGKSKETIVWLTDELLPKCGNWEEMKTLLKRFLQLVGNPEYTHVLQDPVVEYIELASVIRQRLLEDRPEVIVVLHGALKDFVLTILDSQNLSNNIPVLHLQPSRERDILNDRLSAVGYMINKGEKPEVIREKIGPFTKIWILDTIAFGGGTLEKVMSELGIGDKELSIIVMGITPKVEEQLKKGNIQVYSNFKIEGWIKDLWHIDDFLNPLRIGDLRPRRDASDNEQTLSASESFKRLERDASDNEQTLSAFGVFEILIPFFNKEKSLEEIIKQNKIPRIQANPNLFFGCGEGRYVGEHISTNKLIENSEEITEILRKAQKLITSNNKEWLEWLSGIIKQEFKLHEDNAKRTKV